MRAFPFPRSLNVEIAIVHNMRRKVFFHFKFKVKTSFERTKMGEEEEYKGCENCKNAETTALSCKQIWEHKSFMFQQRKDSKHTRVQLENALERLSRDFLHDPFEQIVISWKLFYYETVNPDPVSLIYCCLQTSIQIVARSAQAAMSQQGCGKEIWPEATNVNNLTKSTAESTRFTFPTCRIKTNN